MVLQSPQTSRTPWSFRPLAGISCNIRCSVSKPSIRGFRPPYGDGTAKWVDMTDASWFSPPYGDSTACLMCFMAGCCFFRPLTGMVLCLMSLLCFPLSFRPLTGMVFWWLALITSRWGFRPLTGRTLSVTAYAVPAPPEGGSLSPGNGSCKSSPFGRAGTQRLRGFCGDKLKCCTFEHPTGVVRFRPLAGIG